jgi:peptidoglycan/xylan/chitin deacetylase (PgdA/CDA1 family)
MRAEAGPRLPILLYHGVGPPPLDPFAVTPARFAEHMDALRAAGRRPLTIGELARELPLPADAVAVTFDDGTADFSEHAWPILRERGLPVTLYVTSGLVGARHEGRPMLSWEQLAELRDGGAEIGAHGQRHVALDILPVDRAALELVNSRLELEGALGAPVRSCAYPFGYHTAAVKRLAARAGYTSACAVRNALSHPWDDRYALARVTVTEATDVEALLAGRGAPVAAGGERVRTRAWRLYRRARELV